MKHIGVMVNILIKGEYLMNIFPISFVCFFGPSHFTVNIKSGDFFFFCLTLTSDTQKIFNVSFFYSENIKYNE